jgi:hypothetical protein
MKTNEEEYIVRSHEQAERNFSSREAAEDEAQKIIAAGVEPVEIWYGGEHISTWQTHK